MKKQRYEKIDIFRGIMLISMIFYHATWDLVYMFDVPIRWYQSEIGYIWQQSICWSFILLAGFCWSLGSKKLYRGCSVFAAGLMISLATLAVIPKNSVIFGILTLIGSCALLFIPLEKLLRKIPAIIGLLVSIGCFILTRNINRGYLGFESIHWIQLPDWLYQNYATAYLGFPPPNFYSVDYFSLFPWFFLYLAGYFFYRQKGVSKKFLKTTSRDNMQSLSFIGRHSLFIYMLHQPLLYGTFTAMREITFILN